MDLDLPKLTDFEARVLGCLIEKETSTPEYYPLTLKSLTAACNQKSNRRPVMSIDSTDVVRALDGLRDKRLAWEATSSAARVPKYQHRFVEQVGTTPEETAVLCELLLRGPQTAGELRGHASRLISLSTESLTTALGGLEDREEGALTALLPREPGKRERRYAHLLCGTPELAPSEEAAPPEAARVAVREADTRQEQLDERVTALEAALAEFQRRFETFTQQFE